MNLNSTHDFNFHPLCVRRNTTLIFLVNSQVSQMQCSHVIQTQAQKCDGMDINFDAVYQGHSKFARETSKTQTALIGSIFSDQRNPAILMRWRTIYTSAHTQAFKIHLKYIKLIYVFGSAHVKIGVNQSRSTAVIPGWARREERLSRSELCQPFRIDSDAVLHMNLIHWIRFGSCEVRRLNRALECLRLLCQYFNPNFPVFS